MQRLKKVVAFSRKNVQPRQNHAYAYAVCGRSHEEYVLQKHNKMQFKYYRVGLQDIN